MLVPQARRYAHAAVRPSEGTVRERNTKLNAMAVARVIPPMQETRMGRKES